MSAVRKQRYIPALDGVRAIAVIAVVLYHLRLPWIQGGLLGVTMFFVISGFIITRLLINEVAQTRKIDFKRFYLRRARRLLPAIVVVVLVTVVLCALFNHVMLTKMRPDILPSMLFFNNWWQIINDVSYFNALGDPSPLTHFWSLAIEEQFYLIWPPVLLLLFRAGLGRRGMQAAVLALAAVSAVAMAVLYTPGADPSRLYYGTDTRAFSLLLGVWLAFVPPRALDGASGRRGRALEAAGVAGLLGLLAMFALTNGYTSFQYQGGMVLCSVLTLMLIAGAVRARPDALLARGLSAAPLRWVGTRSYSIYLWHYPLLLLMNPSSNVQARPWWATALELAAVLVAAEASYRLIETPFRHGALGRFVAAVRGTAVPTADAGAGAVAAVGSDATDTAAAAAAVAAADAVSSAVAAAADPDAAPAPQTAAAPAGESLAVGSTGAWDPRSASAGAGPIALLKRARSRAAGLVPSALRTRVARIGAGNLAAASAFAVLLIAAGISLAVVPDTSALSEEGAAALAQSGSSEDGGGQKASYAEGAYDILMIGDSVSVRAVPYFEETFPHGKIDAHVNRQFGAGVELLREYVDTGQAGGIVVMALGTNGLVTDELVDQAMQIAGADRRVVFVTTRSPQPWVGDTNAALARAPERYKNVRVVDWYGYSEGRNDVFDGDGTHLNEDGARTYIQLIKDAVADVLPIHAEENKEALAEAQRQRMTDVANRVLSVMAKRVSAVTTKQ
ncbi:MAG: acyltransferase family protein [Collinsella sp.]|nr:acyltransferase family protein [Collinsella sp.]